MSDPASYKELFPPIAIAISKATAFPIVSRARFITERLGDADPEIQEYGLKVMKKVYEIQPDDMMSENERNVIGGGGGYKRKSIGQVIGFSKVGMEYLNSQPKQTSTWKASGQKSDLYTFSGRFQANPVFEGSWCLVDHTQRVFNILFFGLISDRQLDTGNSHIVFGSNWNGGMLEYWNNLSWDAVLIG